VDSPLPAERHRRIEEFLRNRHVARVSTLSELLNVSEVTVRRDLEVLERRGTCERIHGGAVATHRMRVEPAYREALEAHRSEKALIAHAAARLVQAGDTIFLNGGTTTLEVFRALPAADVKVVTNHVGIAYEAARKQAASGEIIVLAGQYRGSSNSLVGPMTRASIGSVYANKTFLGVEGFSLRYGLTTPSQAEAEIATLMIERTLGDVIVVADHSKLGTVADFVIADIDQISRLVTDRINEEYERGLANVRVEVIVASHMRELLPLEGGMKEKDRAVPEREGA
jgi:DeoR/GlpR family transcriptional regulator of sugar metabolism